MSYVFSQKTGCYHPLHLFTNFTSLPYFLSKSFHLLLSSKKCSYLLFELASSQNTSLTRGDRFERVQLEKLTILNGHYWNLEQNM